MTFASGSDKFEINDMLYELGDTATALLDASGSGVSVITDLDRWPDYRQAAEPGGFQSVL